MPIGEQPPRIYPVRGRSSFTGIRSHFLLPEAFAASLGENIEQVFKTLVLHGDKSGYFVCVIPGEHEVDLKLAAT